MTAPPITLGFVLNDAARLFRKRFEQNARELGYTRAQFQVLAYLARNEGLQQRSLADILEVEAITLGRILDRLEAAGLIERRAHPTDRRVWQLYLRPLAHDVLDHMRTISETTRAEAMADLNEEEQAQLMRLLDRLKGNLIATCNGPSAERKVNNG